MLEVLGRIGFGLFGLAVLLAIVWLFSSNRRAVDWKLVLTGVALQIVIACFVLLTPFGAAVFDALSAGFVKLLGFTLQGSRLIFGSLADQTLVGQTFAVGAGDTEPGAYKKYGFIFAFQVLPTIIFFAAFMSVLYHLGIMQAVVKGMAWVHHQGDAGLGRGNPERLRQRLHRPDRGAAGGQAVRRGHDPLRAADPDGRRHGHDRRRRAGRLRAMLGGDDPAAAGLVRQAPADRQHHGGTGNPGDRQDPDAGSRHAADPGQGRRSGEKGPPPT
jgi:hypothetical protein